MHRAFLRKRLLLHNGFGPHLHVPLPLSIIGTPRRVVTKPDDAIGSASWPRALTIAERQEAMRGKPIGARRGEARGRLERWRGQYPFDSEEVFAKRLAAAGLSEAEFETLLALPAEKIARRWDRPVWVDDLRRAYSEKTSPEPLPDTLEKLRQNPAAGFLRLIEPLLSRGCAQLRRRMEAFARGGKNVPFQAAAVEKILLNNSLRRFSWMLSRTLVLELHVARLKGLLSGDNGPKRFASFGELISNPQRALSICEEYPVLARQVVQCIDQWIEYGLEFLTHLCADYDAIAAAFAAGRDLGELSQIQNEAGDRHRGGRAVIIAGFSSGFQVVYKPRSLAIDVHFAHLQQWANQCGFEPPFRPLQAIDRGSYGWEEFVAAQDCSSEEELHRFYVRQGGNLALLYLLEATDFHHENLIAAGEHPLLPDLEALFTPWVVAPEWKQEYRFVDAALTRSVLRAGLLPQKSTDQPDFSGLGSVEGQISPFPVPQWEELATDTMRYVRKPLPMRGAVNRPTLGGAPVGPTAHVGALVAGFADLYRIVLRHRGEFLADDGPLSAFANDETRVIFRPTLTYGHLLEESFHPDVLRDAIDRDCLLDRLWAQVDQLPHLALVVASEQRSLQRGDIPRFTTKPGSRDIWTDAGERLDDLIEERALDMVRSRVLGAQRGRPRAASVDNSIFPCDSRLCLRRPAPSGANAQGASTASDRGAADLGGTGHRRPPRAFGRARRRRRELDRRGPCRSRALVARPRRGASLRRGGGDRALPCASRRHHRSTRLYRSGTGGNLGVAAPDSAE